MVQMNPHSAPNISPLEILRSALRNREIIFQMVKRDILARYRGSLLGVVWSFVTPLLMLTIYTVLFSVVFKARWGVEQMDNHADYAVILFVGLIIHSLFSECINRAPLLITSNANFVKKIVFPLEILPWITLGCAVFQACISLGVLLLAQLLLSGYIPWTAIFLPIIVAPFILMILGFLWFLAAMGVYIRDISHFTGLITSIMLFVSPVFYSISMLPEKIRTLALLNPLTVVITELRNVLLFGIVPNGLALSIYSVCSIVVAWIGFVSFQKTRQGFADVL